MKKSSLLAGLALAIVLVASSTEAQAQYVRAGRTQTFVGAGGPVALTPGAGVAVGGYSSGYATAPVVGGYTTAPVYHYSYYALPYSTTPARAYVGLGGATDFPFYGQVYGHPYDPWTWPYLANSGRGLVRYYDPPVK